MIAALRDFVDRFLGRGDATITVPSFDGALKPNQILEQAETIGQFDAPEDLATDGQRSLHRGWPGHSAARWRRNLRGQAL